MPIEPASKKNFANAGEELAATIDEHLRTSEVIANIIFTKRRLVILRLCENPRH
jgi:hypothetical protein